MSITETTGQAQYLSFTLGEEMFALDIAKVREVLEFTGVTKVPSMPDFMRGVINLRGSVVPVVDLRLKFGMSPTEKDINTCVIITEIFLNGESNVIGALADSVQEVFELDTDHIEAAPKLGTTLDTDFLLGMGRRNEDFVLLLDIGKVFSSDDMKLTANVLPEPDQNSQGFDIVLD